jgi:hypothetical protein
MWNFWFHSRVDVMTTKPEFLPVKIDANFKWKEMFGSTPQKMEGLCYVTPLTGHKAYTGKEKEYILFLSCPKFFDRTLFVTISVLYPNRKPVPLSVNRVSYYRAGYCSVNVLDFYSEAMCFKSRPVYRILLLWFRRFPQCSVL